MTETTDEAYSFEYFDSEDERHISKIMLKDENNENLLTYLRKTFENSFEIPSNRLLS